MISARKFAIAGLAIVALASLGGCGDKEQVIKYEQGKYQGKPDGQPWENGPADALYTNSTWNKGDKASWETALRTRSQNQNEYVHIDR